MKTPLLALLSTVLIANLAQAQLVPGAPGGGNSGQDSRPPQYDPCDSPINNCGGSSSNEDRERDRYGRDQERNREIERRERDSRSSSDYDSDSYNDDYYRDRRYPSYPDNSHYISYADSFERHIGRSVMNESISLMRVFNLSNYKGNLSKVTADTTPNSSARTEVLLIADGMIVAQQINPGHKIQLYPNQKVRFGNRLFRKGITDLKLVIKGSTYINNIQMYF